MATIDIFKYVKELESFPAGTTIFAEGDSGDVMYVLRDGEAEIRVGQKVLETVGPGGIFGEMALIDTTPRSATVVAKSDCTAVAIDEKDFESHVHRTPFFALQVMRVMTERLRKMNAQV